MHEHTGISGIEMYSRVMCNGEHEERLSFEYLLILIAVRSPCRQYQSHVRNHFATNLGAAGGLLLLQCYGPGRYTVDGLLKAKKDK